jgi:hypothetical protein
VFDARAQDPVFDSRHGKTAPDALQVQLSRGAGLVRALDQAALRRILDRAGYPRPHVGGVGGGSQAAEPVQVGPAQAVDVLLTCVPGSAPGVLLSALAWDVDPVRRPQRLEGGIQFDIQSAQAGRCTDRAFSRSGSPDAVKARSVGGRGDGSRARSGCCPGRRDRLGCLPGDDARDDGITGRHRAGNQALPEADGARAVEGVAGALWIGETQGLAGLHRADVPLPAEIVAGRIQVREPPDRVGLRGRARRPSARGGTVGPSHDSRQGRHARGTHRADGGFRDADLIAETVGVGGAARIADAEALAGVHVEAALPDEIVARGIHSRQARDTGLVRRRRPGIAKSGGPEQQSHEDGARQDGHGAVEPRACHRSHLVDHPKFSVLKVPAPAKTVNRTHKRCEDETTSKIALEEIDHSTGPVDEAD